MIDLYCESYTEADAAGRPAVVFGTIQDVTNQRRFEAELTEIVHRNHLLLATIDACPISITLADSTQPDLPLIYANRKFLEIVGYEADEVIGQNCRFLQGPATDPQVVAAIRQTIADGRQGEFHFVNYRRDGTMFNNHMVLAPIRDADGEVAAYVGLQADATLVAKRQEAEAQRQKMEALGRMMGGVAHEINNMLQPVTLLGQDILEKNLVLEPGRPHVEVVLDCSRRAQHIIGDLLAFSRPTARDLKVFDPVALLHDSLRIVRPSIPATITLVVDITGAPPNVAVDRTMFVQILLNLVTNAVAAMAGRGTLTIALDEDEGGAPDASHAVRLRVADSGRGMDRKTLDRAFEPFFTTKPVGQGTGLGLPMVYGLIRELGGTITLESEPGCGTTARILLPPAPAHGETKHGIDTDH